MRYSFVHIISSLASSALAIPAPQASAVSGPIDPSAVVSDQVLPTGASGSLRGSESLIGYASSNPLSTESTIIPPDEFELGTGQSADADEGLYIDLTNVKNPQPIRGGTTGPTDPGPRYVEQLLSTCHERYSQHDRTAAYDALNSDIFAPPTTDSGDVGNAKWPFGLSHNRHGLAGAGWARNQNVNQLPIATAMAGVDMRLSPHAYRELHWHKQGEWALMYV